MPILWIEEGSPLTVAVKSDEGEVLNRMEVDGVDGKNAVWRVIDMKDPGQGPSVHRKAFRMRRADGAQGRFVLGIEFRPDG